MEFREKIRLVSDILERDYTRHQLIEWLIDIMGEQTMNEILHNEAENSGMMGEI